MCVLPVCIKTFFIRGFSCNQSTKGCACGFADQSAELPKEIKGENWKGATPETSSEELLRKNDLVVCEASR